MRTSSFEHIVRLQFNSLMLIIIKNKLKSRYRQLATLFPQIKNLRHTIYGLMSNIQFIIFMYRTIFIFLQLFFCSIYSYK